MKRVLLAISAAAALAAPAMANEALAKTKNCMTCHAVDKKVIGPAYKDVAAKYKGDKDATAKLTTSIMKGSTGKWPGVVPMPANTQVSEAEAKTLVAWILAAK